MVGDTFTLPVAAGSGKYKLSLAAAVDGSQTPVAVLGEDCDASAADKKAIAYFSGQYNDNKITLGTGHSVASVKDDLDARSIYLETPGATAA